ncbi:MAG TPA: HTTM domain-containing protein, partial [Arenibacter sp.]|nr:HTTM domain-containing protein [Arenibacter sp.]
GVYTYIIFLICGVSALLVALGWKYRISTILLFLSFTYIELMDKTNYLNHYYFVSLVCFILIFLPANTYFSIDTRQKPSLLADKVPAWTINILKVLLAMVYFYAGLAKLNSDWLLHALPLKLWLPARNDLPIIGSLFNFTWIAFAFSWMGALYDLCIAFFLLWPKTRLFAYFTVIIFHGLTALLFQIGMFPYVMIVVTLIFFSADFHQQIINRLASAFRCKEQFFRPQRAFSYAPWKNKAFAVLFSILLLFQLLFPFRYLLYPGELFWTEEGYRFSWRVMLMEKTGYATFYVHDSVSDQKVMINNMEYLTPLQEKMMATQTDMMLQYAHFLKTRFITKGFTDPKVFAEVYITLNGRENTQFIDPGVDLAKERDSFAHKTWILPFNDTIKGF